MGMRIVTYGAACSLDGFIADPQGGVGWLHLSRDVQAIMAEYWATIDTLVWGRKTWDMGGGPAKSMRNYVFSRTSRPAPFVSADPGAYCSAPASRSSATPASASRWR